LRTPLAIFAFNRPDHLQRLLQSLAVNPRLDECHPFIFCDGPKDPAQAPSIEATRNVAREWIKKHGGELVERPQNRGLAASIVGTVKELCDAEGRAIVLEDDLVLRPQFLHFCLEGLRRFEDSPQVKQISGYAYPIDAPVAESGYFLPLTSGWGWATWRRAWKDFDWKPSGAREALNNPEARHRFDVHGSYPYSQMLADRLDGKNQSWGVLWQWIVHRDEGLVLFPRETLVWNCGYDGTGTHAGNQVEYAATVTATAPSPSLQVLTFPERIQCHDLALQRVAHCLRHRTGEPAPFSQRLLKQIQRILG